LMMSASLIGAAASFAVALPERTSSAVNAKPLDVLVLFIQITSTVD
jgi:hypothetical protein